MFFCLLPFYLFFYRKKIVSKTALVSFWVMWLLDVLMTLFGYREFVTGIFGRYSSPSGTYVTMWAAILIVAFGVISGSLYFKKHGQTMASLIVAAIPLVLALPYLLFLAVVMLSGNTNWQ